MGGLKEKIKVVWLCHFSNAFVHEKLDLQYNRLIGLVKHLAYKPVSTEVPEFANWITNGIREFEKFDEVELHVVSPYPYLRRKTQEFEAKGVYYHFFRSEENSLSTFLYRRLFKPSYYRYGHNCRLISRIIDRIRPNVVHLFGAENPEYGHSLLSIPDEIVTIVQLQTLLNDPDMRKNYPKDDIIYSYKANVEKSLIQKAIFLGTPALKYRQIIRSSIKPDAIFLNIGLALKDSIDTTKYDKQYDFVYFAANINKAADLALEAFGIASQKEPSISLDIVGYYDIEYKNYLDDIIRRYNIKDNVKFEGMLATHEDVLNHIRLSRFALLPLRTDLTSGTIREAMSNGIPVLTTDTGELGTQKLNLKRQNVLISPIGDHQALADNMIRLLKDEKLADTIRQNAYQSRSEARSNETVVRQYVQAYRACIDNYRNGTPLPEEILNI